MADHAPTTSEARPAKRSRPAPPPPADKGIAGRLVYRLSRLGSLVALRLVYRLHSRGGEHSPAQGPFLVIANHQSHLDAPAIAVSLPRTDMAFLGRRGLFKNRAFGWLITNLNTIPMDEDRGDLGAIRTALGALAAGRPMMLFPEGARSPDGAMRPFKRGAWLLLTRAKCPVLPVAVEGAFDAWPRSRTLPAIFGRRIAVAVGEPIPHGALAAMDPDAGLAHLAAVVDGLRLGLRRDLRERTRGQYPPPSPADQPFAGGGVSPE